MSGHDSSPLSLLTFCLSDDLLFSFSLEKREKKQKRKSALQRQGFPSSADAGSGLCPKTPRTF
jgi:hypothetical protein